MTTGATSTFQETRDQICTDALTNLGAVAPGKDASAARTAGLLAHAARRLNAIVKGMDADGAFLWRVLNGNSLSALALASDGSFIPEAGIVGPPLAQGSVLDIMEPITYSADGVTTTPVMAMSRVDYELISSKLTTGTPARYYVQHNSASGVVSLQVFLYPVPTAGTVNYTVFLRGADFTAGSDTPDFPSKWTNCLVYGLTMDLAPAYRQMPLFSQYKQLFNEEKARLLGDDSERGSVILAPFGAMTSGGGAGW